VSTIQRYRLSFTVGGLLARESIPVASTYLQVGDWVKTRAIVREQNLIQQRAAASTLRLSREIVDRLSTLDLPELELIVEGAANERIQLLWSSLCRTYLIIEEFAREVLRERHLLLTSTVTYDEYDAFIRSKALWHEELDDLKSSTALKMRAELFRMLHEADLLTTAGHIVPPVLSTQVVDLLARRGVGALTVFPITDTAIERMVR
jgi:hypothetical protein